MGDEPDLWDSDLEELEPLPADKLSPSGEDSITSDITKDSSQSTSNAGLFSGANLGLSGHSLDYYLSAVRRFSTGPPTFFLALHLANTSLIPLVTQSIPSSENFLLLTREIYQAPILEPLLVTIPLYAHVISGVALRYLRQSRRARRYGAETREQRKEIRSWKLPSAQALLGYGLAPLVGVHVLVNRTVPLKVDGGSSGVGLGYVAHGFARAPWLMNCYYAALVGVGVWHVVGGWAVWLGYKDTAGRSRIKKTGQNTGANGGYLGSSAAGSELVRRKKRIRWTINGIVIAGTVIWLAGGIGVIGRGGLGFGWEAKNWDRIYSQVPLLGGYLGAPS